MPHTLETQPMAGPALSPLAGKPAPKEMLIDVARLEREYFERRPDLMIATRWSASAPADIAARRCTARSPKRTSWRSPRRSATTARSAGHRRPALHGQGHARAVGAGAAHRARGAGGQRRRDRHPARTTASRRRRSSRARFWSTTAAARSISPTASSSRLRTIRRRMAASSTTRPTAARPIPT